MNTSSKPRRMARPTIDDDGSTAASDTLPEAAPNATPLAQKRVTKQNLVIDCLQRQGGASLAALIEVTGWLPHTARAALTGLRKKGHAIERISIEGETRYTLAPVVAE